MELKQMNKNQLLDFKNQVQKEYDDFKALGLKLDMSRGKPSAEQLDLSMDMLNVLNEETLKNEYNNDYRNYGILDGIPEAKKFFAPMLGVGGEEIIVCGNSSLNIMYWTVQLAYTHGILGEPAWSQQGKVKFLCPSPGYDRHFGICEFFGIEMITVPMKSDGPDMDMIEKLVSEDSMIKGIWCVPQYSNPEGICYSDETVRRFANLKPAAKDFRIFWDNAYTIHHLCDKPKYILNIMQEAKKAGNENIVYIFGSTSKITFPGAGVAMIGASRENIESLRKSLAVCTISYDKLNQLRHVRYFGTFDNMVEYMKKHKEIMRPKFDCVINTLEKKIRPLGIGSWIDPKGGYFISFDSLPGCAKRIVELCKNAGVVLTGAGATFPYKKDPEDKNIRISPSYPTIEELSKAMELFVICIKLASAEKLLAE